MENLVYGDGANFFVVGVSAAEECYFYGSGCSGQAFVVARGGWLEK